MTEFAYKIVQAELAQPKTSHPTVEEGDGVAPRSWQRWTRRAFELIKHNQEFSARVLLTAITASERPPSESGAPDFGQTLLLSRSKLERFQLLIKLWTDIQSREKANGEIIRYVRLIFTFPGIIFLLGGNSPILAWRYSSILAWTTI